MNNPIKKSLITVIIIIVINSLSNLSFKRFDITADKRYTIRESSKKIASKIDKQVLINVYLKGDFPSEFQRLQIETQQFLEELSSTNSLINFRFINPKDQRESIIKQGMFPSQLSVEEDGKVSEAIIFPWAKVSYGERTVLVSLLPNTSAKSQEEQLENAISNLEFSFTDALHKITTNQRKKIAVLSGNGELEDKYLFSFLSEVRKKYSLAKFTLDSVAKNPKETLKELNKFDMAIIAKPTERFSEKEKLTLDQFIINGGKSLWMIDTNVADTDSLYNEGKMLAYPRDLNTTDLLFSYGVRINNKLIQDLNAAKIPLATGNLGKQAQFKNLNWFYHPLAQTNPLHPITKNIIPIRLRFTTQIDTLKSDIKKTPLLISSLLTKKVGTPTIIQLKDIAKRPTQQEYNAKNQLFAVLLEGSFKSAYEQRTLPYKITNLKTKSDKNKMIIVADGDIGKNQILKGIPHDLGYDKWTRERFGNKDFLLNAVDYLLDDIGIIELRNKTIKIRNLNKQKTYTERSFWQFLNIILPLFLLFIFGISFNYIRKNKYTKKNRN